MEGIEHHARAPQCDTGVPPRTVGNQFLRRVLGRLLHKALDPPRPTNGDGVVGGEWLPRHQVAEPHVGSHRPGPDRANRVLARDQGSGDADGIPKPLREGRRDVCWH